MINFCMTPPSNGSPAPPPLLQPQLSKTDESTRKFNWPSGGSGKNNGGNDGKEKPGTEIREEEDGETRRRDESDTGDCGAMETDGN